MERGKCFKLKEDRFKIGIRKKSFILRVLRHGNRRLKEVVDAPFWKCSRRKWMVLWATSFRLLAMVFQSMSAGLELETSSGLWRILWFVQAGDKSWPLFSEAVNTQTSLCSVLTLLKLQCSSRAEDREATEKNCHLLLWNLHCSDLWEVFSEQAGWQNKKCWQPQVPCIEHSCRHSTLHHRPSLAGLGRANGERSVEAHPWVR